MGLAYFALLFVYSTIGVIAAGLLFPNHTVTAAVIWGVFAGLSYKAMVWDPFLARFFEKKKEE